MPFSCTLRGERFTFGDLRDLLAKANEEKAGDALAGIAAATHLERAAAKTALADVALAEFLDRPLLCPDDDDVSRVLLDDHDAAAFADFRSLTVGELREHLLDDATTPADIRRLQRALLPEMAAAVAKLMGNKDLVLAASRIRNVSRCRTTLGQPGVLGIRIQPNHPADDVPAILLATIEGLLHGCGDAVIGVNPAIDSVETVTAILQGLDRLITGSRIPTQHCCLAHITTQLECLDRGVPIDLLFQSIGGTQRTNDSFGFTLGMLQEGRERVLEVHLDRESGSSGRQVMYFETGQGSSLSADAHHGIDQLTLEARAQGLARAFDPFLVNSVVGFIGPEYLCDERQIVRAGLEDHFLGKLLGLPMGCDVCYTNHAAADQNSAENLLMLLSAAGANYFMGVPGGDDVMLAYQTTSYHDAIAMRSLFGLRPAPEFERWLEAQAIMRDGVLLASPGQAAGRLLAHVSE
jgi:ethanolamine ammonia-lyase large subunit